VEVVGDAVVVDWVATAVEVVGDPVDVGMAVDVVGDPVEVGIAVDVVGVAVEVGLAVEVVDVDDVVSGAAVVEVTWLLLLLFRLAK